MHFTFRAWLRQSECSSPDKRGQVNVTYVWRVRSSRQSTAVPLNTYCQAQLLARLLLNNIGTKGHLIDIRKKTCFNHSPSLTSSHIAALPPQACPDCAVMVG